MRLHDTCLHTTLVSTLLMAESTLSRNHLFPSFACSVCCVQALRSFWLYMALFRLSSPGSAPIEWCIAAGVVASTSPMLMIGAGGGSTDQDALERLKVSNAHMTSLRSFPVLKSPDPLRFGCDGCDVVLLCRGASSYFLTKLDCRLSYRDSHPTTC